MGTLVDTRSSATPAPAGEVPSSATGARAEGLSLVSQASDPGTGQVNTRTLAQWVADASRQDPALASQAGAAIESQLMAQGRIGDVARFHQDLREAQAELGGSHGVPGMLMEAGRQALREGGALMERGAATAAAGTRQLIDNPILTKSWESTTSAWTGKGGFSEPLTNVLQREGIVVSPQVNATPAGSVARNQGVPANVANNTNGSAARDAIAQRYTQAGAQVRTEVPTNGGQRRIDVRADFPAADPRMSERVDIESKSGRAGSSSTTRGQAAQDGLELRANRAARQGGLALEETGQAMSRSGRVLHNVGRVARPLGVALSVVEVGQAYRADGNRVGEHTGRAASGVAGGALGAWGGVALGAAIGSAVPVVGTLVGGIVGGIIGGLGGDAAGRGLFNAVKGWF